MPILNYTTEIAVAKTSGEITQTLARRGVSRISTLFDENGVASGIAFTMHTEYGPREFELPVRTDGVLAAMQRDPKVPKSKQTREQAARVAWRIELRVDQRSLRLEPVLRHRPGVRPLSGAAPRWATRPRLTWRVVLALPRRPRVGAHPRTRVRVAAARVVVLARAGSRGTLRRPTCTAC